MSRHSSRSRAELPSDRGMVHIEIDLRDKLWQELKTACEEAGWETMDGLPILLAIALSALETPKKGQSDEKT